MSKRVLLANMLQESCSFVRTRTDLDTFRRYYLLQGDAILERFRGDGNSELAGIISVADQEGIELVPSLAAYGSSGGIVTTAAYEWMRDCILDCARQNASNLDGAILALHGAMVTEDLDDPEGDLVSRLRAILGPDKPIVCSLDLHAHITDELVSQASALVAYHTHPHIDFRDTGIRAMRVLALALSGQVRPVAAHHKLPMITPPERHNTSRLPMNEIMGHVLAAEKMPGMLAAAIFPVQAQLDISNLGWSVVAVADGDAALARRQADAIAELAWDHRRDFLITRTPVAEAVRQAREAPEGPVILADGSDSTAGGADGDSTWILRQLLETPVAGPCLLTLTDPDAVACCIAAGIRSEVTLDIGGSLNPDFSTPTRVTGRVRTISDGLWQMKLPPFPADRGRTVVLQVGDVSIVIAEKPYNTWDEEFYRSVGLFPRESKVVVVKSPGGFRAVYEPFAKLIVDVDAPGPVDSDLKRLPFRRVPRPLFPLDDI